MAILDGLLFTGHHVLSVTITAATINKSFIKNGRAVAADFSLYAANAPASPGATDKVVQGVLMREDGVIYVSTSILTPSFALPSGISLGPDREVLIGPAAANTSAMRVVFDPLIGTVRIGSSGRVQTNQ